MTDLGGPSRNPVEAGAAGDAARGAEATGPIEVELKYDVTDPGALEPAIGGPAIAGLEAGSWELRLVEDRYVDSAERDVERAGYAARLRRRGDTLQVGVKSLSAAEGAVHRREELEAPLGEADPLDPAAWPPSPARKVLLRALGGAPLQERFLLRQRRRVRDLRGPDGSAELSLDEVEVLRDGERLGAFAELEVELREGDERLLGPIADALEETGAVRPSGRSKFETARGLAEKHAGSGVFRAPAASVGDAALERAAHLDDRDAHDGRDQSDSAPAPSLALAPGGKSPGVSADDPLAEAGRKVLRFHLARMLAAEQGTRSGEDPEDLHKMRVATRRMRAAWRVFDGSFRPRRARRSVAGLRTLATDLGRVRDLDVLLEGLAAYGDRAGTGEAAALAPLAAAWRTERNRARASLVRYLDSDAYERFVDDQVAFVRSDGLDAIPAGPTDPRTVRDLAPARIWDAYAHVRAFDAVLRWADLPTIHALRIAGKRLRYAVEFFREPLGPEASTLIERVTALQDHLGLLHDADVAAGLARAFLVRETGHAEPGTIEAVGRYLEDREREVARLRRTLGPVWRRVTSLEFRRALGRATAQL